MNTRIITLATIFIIAVSTASCQYVSETKVVTTDDEWTEKLSGWSLERVIAYLGEPKKQCSYLEDSVAVTELTFTNTVHIYWDRKIFRRVIWEKDGKRPYIKVYFHDSDGLCYSVKTNITKEFHRTIRYQSIISLFTSALLLVIGFIAVIAAKRKHTTWKNSRPVVIMCTAAALLCIGFDIWGIQIKKIDAESENRMEAKKEALKQMQGVPAPDFKGVTAAGDTVWLSDYTCKGQYVLLDFWASWCGPCKRFLPIIRDFDNNFPQLKVIGVNVNDSMDKALECISTENMTWDVIITDDTSVMDLYHCNIIPSCYLIDTTGVMVISGMHPKDLETKITEYLTHPNE